MIGKSFAGKPFDGICQRGEAVGEASGKMEEMLLRVSHTYDKEVARAIKQIISLIEPILITFMAMVIGFIVISMLLAIFSINEINF